MSLKYAAHKIRWYKAMCLIVGLLVFVYLLLLLIMNRTLGDAFEYIASTNNYKSSQSNFDLQLAKYDTIILALEKFHDESGVYPVHLEQLVTNYLSAVPSSTASGALRIDEVFYDPIAPNKPSKWNNKIFIGTNVPPYTLTLWGSGGVLGSDTSIRYCPEIYDCRFKMEVSVPTKTSKGYKTEEKEFDPVRLTDTWVELQDF